MFFSKLLEDFLSLGKLEEGKVSVSISSFAVKEFIEDVIEEMRVIQKKGQQIICKYEGADEFSTDKRLLKNILINHERDQSDPYRIASALIISALRNIISALIIKAKRLKKR